jgi:type I restriction enzyme S subunit
MSNLEIFITNPISISPKSFYPRNYNPNFLLVKDGMKNNPTIKDYIAGEIKGGSTPPAYLFTSVGKGIPFIKTAAVTRHFINVNDLQSINEQFHRTKIKRSITRPYDVIYTMTGKFMGKAAMCPCTISEMNMSQNSVVFHNNSREEAAFLTIYLNSQINRIQVRGTYSITKQKFMNQSKIASLKVFQYDAKYDYLMGEYLSAFDTYYKSVEAIKRIIEQFNSKHNLVFSDEAQYGFVVKPNAFEKRMLAPNYYRQDVSLTINGVVDGKDSTILDPERTSKGDEVGSANYTEEGIPFIKTSDIINYDVDYEPDCFCPEYFVSQLGQGIKKGDIIFAKDGKPGEIAIIEEDSNVVISSGLVKYHPKDDEERYWVFLLLASKYGDAYFKKWFVIASTMLHLRQDFFDDFKIPEINDEVMADYINPLKNAFEKKRTAYETIRAIKDKVEKSFTDTNVDLTKI